MRPVYLLSPTLSEGTVSLPMIRFALTAKKIDFKDTDTLMFTSKQAVISADQIDKRWREYPVIAIGAATAKQIRQSGGKVLHQPSAFYAKALSKDIIKHFSDRKVLYLRPQSVSFDAKGYLQKAGIHLQEQIIYQTLCIDYAADAAPPLGSIIIFTSPSTIHCFLKNFTWHKSYTAVVIGEATLEHLPKDAAYAVADQPLIASCIAKAKEISLTSNPK